MTRATIAAAAILASILALWARGVVHDRHAIAPARVGAPLAALAVVATDGHAASLDIRRGTVVYNVFATWCPDCRSEIAQLVRADGRLRAHGVRVVGIDQGEDADAVRAFVARARIGYPVYVDPDAHTIAALGARVIPTTVVVSDGIVRRIVAGPLAPEEILAFARDAEQ